MFSSRELIFKHRISNKFNIKSITENSPSQQSEESFEEDYRRPRGFFGRIFGGRAFDKDSDEAAQFSIAFPKSWNEGTITFQPFFTANTTNTGDVKIGFTSGAVHKRLSALQTGSSSKT